jgi:WD40 repeat protein
LIFSADNKMLAAHADAETLGIWDTATGKPIGSLPLPKGAPLVHPPPGMDSAAFSPEGRCLVLDRDDGTAVLYELATGKPRCTFGTKVAPKEVPQTIQDFLLPDEFRAGSCFAFSPDGKMLARGGYDHIVHLWDVETGAPLAAFAGHGGAVTALAFSPDGKNPGLGQRRQHRLDLGREQAEALTAQERTATAEAVPPSNPRMAPASGLRAEQPAFS